MRIDTEPALFECLTLGRMARGGEIIAIVDAIPIVGIDASTRKDPHPTERNLRIASEHQCFEALGPVPQKNHGRSKNRLRALAALSCPFFE